MPFISESNDLPVYLFTYFPVKIPDKCLFAKLAIGKITMKEGMVFLFISNNANNDFNNYNNKKGQ